MNEMAKDSTGVAIQTFPYSPGLCNLASGTYDCARLSMFRCSADGDLTITWSDLSTDVISCTTGMDGTFPGALRVTITSGTFSLA
jgi:hypothetical protein